MSETPPDVTRRVLEEATLGDDTEAVLRLTQITTTLKPIRVEGKSPIGVSSHQYEVSIERGVKDPPWRVVEFRPWSRTFNHVEVAIALFAKIYLDHSAYWSGLP